MDDLDILANEIDDNVALAIEIFGNSDSESIDRFGQALALDKADKICTDLIIIVENGECLDGISYLSSVSSNDLESGIFLSHF